MIKNALAFAATALFSLNASAGYVQYNFSGELSGYVVQRDDNKAIAYYDLGVHNFYVDTRFTPQGYRGNVKEEYNGFSNEGPTGFRIFLDSPSGASFDSLRVNFEPNNPVFAYAAFFSHGVSYTGDLSTNKGTFESSYFSTATKGSVDPALVADLDRNGGYAANIVRFGRVQEVPEPATIALFAIAGLGAAGAVRRRKLSA